jgi:hypothetical protein
MTVLGWKGKEIEVRSSFANWANRTFYPCLVVYVILAICFSDNLVRGAAIVVGIEFVTGLNELAGEGNKSRRAIAAGVAALALLVSMAEFRNPFEHAVTWLLRPANWVLAAGPIVWTAVSLRKRPGWRQFLTGGLAIVLIVWLIRGFYLWIGVVHPEQTWSDLLSGHNK